MNFFSFLVSRKQQMRHDIVRMQFVMAWLCGAFFTGLSEVSPSLPAHISVLKSWDSLALTQLDQEVLGNSSLQSHFQSLLLLQAPGEKQLPVVQASFGPFTVKQELSLPLLSLPSSLSASILGGPDGGVVSISRPWVRVLFHWGGVEREREREKGGERCVTLHAFRETEELQTSCLIQSSSGVCVANLTFPQSWFTTETGKTRAADGSSSSSSAEAELYYSVSPLAAAPPACLETVLQASQNELHYTGAVSLRSGGAPGPDSGEEEEEELRLDPNVVIRSPKGPLKLGQPIKVGVLLRENCTAELVVIRAKLKKGLSVESVSPSLTSDDWTVSVEEALGSKHHTTSLTIRRAARSHTHSSVLFWEPARLSLQSDNFTGPAVTRRISWQVEYLGQNPLWGSEGGAALTRITLTHRALLGIVPVTQTPSLVNTAILTGLRVSLPVTVLAVEHDGTVFDVTHYVTCRSTNEDIVKVSSDCSSVFVDGFESSQGGLGVRVEFQLESLAGALLLSVWVPRLPLTLQLSDAQLSQIRGWRAHSNTDCSPQYQRSTVQVLAQFAAVPLDPEGQLTFMLGSPDWFVDVTELVRDWLRTAEPRIATLSPEGILIGREPGVTSLQVVSSLWDTVIGQREVTVSSDKVTLGDLSVQLISGLTLSIKPSAGLHGVVTATASAQQQLHTYRQEAVLSIWLQFSDDTTIPLETFDPGTYSLRLLSLAEGVVTLETVATETDRGDGGKPLPLVVARGDGGGPLIRAELSDTGCHRLKKEQQQPIRKKTGVLAGGSGWVRVNFDLRRRGEGDSGEGEDYFRERRKVWRGERRQEEGEEDSLEDQRKVLREEGASVDEASSEDQPGFLEWEPTGGRGAAGGRRLSELEIGMYALLAAFCLAILAFLANCVMFILKSRRKGGLGGGGEDSGKSRHNWLWLGTDPEELGRQADLAADLSQRRKEQGGSEGPYPTAEAGPGVAHASGTRLVFPSAAHDDDHVTPEVEELASQDSQGAGGRVRFAPREDPALAASEGDVEWLCRDMGLSRRSEMESYMEGIRRDSERDS